jgi:glutaredoxin-like protein NrdH
MDRLSIKYDTVDISENQEAFDMLLSKGFKAAPVVITDNDSWAGFQPDKIAELVA